MNPITVIIAEDHPVYRDGFIRLIQHDKEIAIVAGVGNGQELIDAVAIHNPQVILLDLDMPIMNGRESMAILKATHPHIKIIILSLHDSEKTILELVERGCNGYLSKNADYPEIVMTIKMVVERDYYFNERVQTLINKNKLGKKADLPEFSEKEIEIIKLIVKGHSSAEIADELNLSERTIENYRSKMLRKMNVKNAAGTIHYAREHNLLD